MNNEEIQNVQLGQDCEAPVTEKLFDKKDARRTFGRIALGLFAVSFVITALLLAAKQFLPDELLAKPWFPYLFNFVVMYIIAFPIGYLFICRLPRQEPDKSLANTMKAGTFLRIFISAICLMYVGNIVGVIFDALFTSAKYFLREAPIETFTEQLGLDAVWLQIIYVAVIAPIMEEIIFRKVIIDRTKRFGYTPAIIFSGVLFGLFHGNFGQVFYATLVGFLLGYVYVRTGKLINTILLHFAINLYGGVFPVLIFSLMDTKRLDEIILMSDYEIYFESLMQFVGDNIFPIILYAAHATVFFALAVTGLVLLIKDRKRYKAGLVKADPPMPKEKAFSTMFLSVGFLLFCISMLYEFYVSL